MVKKAIPPPAKKRTGKPTIEVLPVDSIKQHPKNARRGDVEAIKDSIRANGLYGALVVQRSSRFILKGNHTWKAARDLGLKKVPVMFVDVDDDRALRILAVDNRTSDLADYDDAGLADILRTLSTAPEGLAGSGYTSKDLDGIEKALRAPAAPDFDEEERQGSELVHTCPRCHHKFK